MKSPSADLQLSSNDVDDLPIVLNHAGLSCEEDDNTGFMDNYLGVAYSLNDPMIEAIGRHEGWESGYDY